MASDLPFKQTSDGKGQKEKEKIECPQNRTCDSQ
jgi:hypothetical protein